MMAGGEVVSKEKMRRERLVGRVGTKYREVVGPSGLVFVVLGGDSLYSWSLLTRLDFSSARLFSSAHRTARKREAVWFCVAGCAESPGGLIGIGEMERRGRGDEVEKRRRIGSTGGPGRGSQ